MKALEITEEQKIKLLKMCKKLFPEYKYISTGELFQEKNKYIEYNEPDISLFHLTSISEDGSFSNIHWFEFCMTHLFKRIFGGKDSKEFTKGPIDTSDYECSIIDIFYSHPIDYLYLEFKKLPQ